MSALLQSGPVIVSEIRVDYSRVFRTNRDIVDLIVAAPGVDAIGKVGMLERLLPGLSSAGECACSCACACSCSCS